MRTHNINGEDHREGFDEYDGVHAHAPATDTHTETRTGTGTVHVPKTVIATTSFTGTSICTTHATVHITATDTVAATASILLSSPSHEAI